MLQKWYLNNKIIMKKINIWILVILMLIVWIFIWVKYEQLSYLDKCLDLWWWLNPWNYNICVIEKNNNVKMIPVESNNWIWNWTPSLDELLNKKWK